MPSEMPGQLRQVLSEMDAFHYEKYFNAVGYVNPVCALCLAHLLFGQPSFTSNHSSFTSLMMGNPAQRNLQIKLKIELGNHILVQC